MTADHLWLILGLLGQAVFGGRFIVQWISSERRRESHIPIETLIVNRMHPAFGGIDVERARAEASRHRGTPLGALWQNLADFRQLAAGEEGKMLWK